MFRKINNNVKALPARLNQRVWQGFDLCRYLFVAVCDSLFNKAVERL